MNIKARINARKILLVYFYEQYFFILASKKDTVLGNIDKVRKIVANPGDEDDIDINIAKVMENDYYGDFDHEIVYIIENYFAKVEHEDIDFDYIKNVWPYFAKYKDLVHEAVDKHAVTFGYDSMDLMDRVLFILGYIEFVELKTPKEIVLNEMVELAKRYGDDSSPKLLNGIGHKIFEELEGGAGEKKNKGEKEKKKGKKKE